MDKQPMTWDEAHEKYMCTICKTGGYCEVECVLSATCSFHCTSCRQRIYFQGDLHDAPSEFTCPYCGTGMYNRYRS